MLDLITSNLKPGAHHLGILGDGQLGLYLTQAAQLMGHKVYLWPPQSQGPAAAHADTPEQVASNFDAFADGCEWLAIENELQALELAQQLSPRNRIKLRPSFEALSTLADKGKQKELLLRLGISSARFELFQGTSADMDAWLERQAQEFPQGFVLKWTRGGYDGRGVKICRDFSALARAELKQFLTTALSKASDVYAEELIAYHHEMAIVATRSCSGELVFYPTVITEQKQGVCHLAHGPASAWGLDAACEQEAQRIAEALACAVDLVGTFAVEFFISRHGALLVNEVAPRVHNSGHFTLSVSPCSQFENHWRSIVGTGLGSTASTGLFAMINILGPDGFEGKVTAFTCDSPLSQVYWYGKKEMRPGRKMGHINVRGANRADLENSLAGIHKQLKSWSDAFTTKGSI